MIITGGNMTEEQKKIQYLIDAFEADDDYHDFMTAKEYFDFREERRKMLCKQEAERKKNEIVELGKSKNNDLDNWKSAFRGYAITVGQHSIEIYNYFIRLYKEGNIPVVIQFPLLMDIYILSNVDSLYNRYLLQMYKDYPDDLKKIMRKEIYNEIKEFEEKDGYFTVYRGEYIEAKYGTSVKINRAISFTFDYDRARFFACRWSPKEAYIYTAKVSFEDIIYYTDERDEKEVILRPVIKGGSLLNLKCETVSPEEYYAYDGAIAKEARMRMAIEKGLEI